MEIKISLNENDPKAALVIKYLEERKKLYEEMNLETLSDVACEELLMLAECYDDFEEACALYDKDFASLEETECSSLDSDYLDSYCDEILDKN